MIENQLLALNQKENLTFGLAVGVAVLAAVGFSGFLYWFFKIRK